MENTQGFHTVTSTDRRAWLWVRLPFDPWLLTADELQVVSLLSLTYSVLLLGARLTCKWEYLSYDDAVLGLGYAFAAAHYGTIFQAIAGGLGALTAISSSSKIASVAEVRRAFRPRDRSLLAENFCSTISHPGSSAFSRCA